MSDMERVGPGRKPGDTAAAVIHIVGAALALAAAPLAILQAARGGPAPAVVGAALYAASIVYYFVISALSHMLAGRAARRVFAVLDDAGSYFLLAGAWTPLCFSLLRGATGWTVFALAWAAAILALVASNAYAGAPRERILAGYYLLLGPILPFVGAVRAGLEGATLAWAGLAGLLYAAGLLFRSRSVNPYNHAVWHAFTTAASICWFFGLGTALTQAG